jgi:hypothetical protein
MAGTTFSHPAVDFLERFVAIGRHVVILALIWIKAVTDSPSLFSFPPLFGDGWISYRWFEEF